MSSYQPGPRNPRKRPAPADTQEAAWVAGEDRFVLQQAKKKAEIRVKEGRAKPIDWLAVTLRFIDPSRDPFDDEIADSELDVVDPEGVFEGLTDLQLSVLEKDIDAYVALETNQTNADFWATMKIICKDRHSKLIGAGPNGRGAQSVASDVDHLFGTKSLTELETLGKQIKAKLSANEPIDIEYWENLLQKLTSWKARAKLRQVSQSIVGNQLQGLRKQQQEEANTMKDRLAVVFSTSRAAVGRSNTGKEDHSLENEQVSTLLDPESMLKIRTEDKALEIQDENIFLETVAADRRKILKLGFVPAKRKQEDPSIIAVTGPKPVELTKVIMSRPVASHNDELSQATTALYEREVARGVGQDEEILASEEHVSSNSQPQWANKHRPRKPRYFNRVQMGYEWNKYNQTHYDHDNPPPKVVQGYKFNVFYPDLIERSKAPTYKIERENGRKRGQSFAPAGEEDTCLIRFIAGPPYEDVAFRIVDKEWDYSAKRERGFRSSFDKGILQLHFQFKKIFYRK